MKQRFVRLCLFVLGIPIASTIASAGVALQSFAVVSSGSSNGVFATIGSQETPGSGHAPGASVVWPVTIDMQTLAALPPSIVINFPDRAAVTLTRVRSEPREPNAFLWTGRGNDCSAMFRSAAVGFRGWISCLNAPYGVDHVPNGSPLMLTRYDPSLVLSALEPPPSNSPSSPTSGAPGNGLTCPAANAQQPDQAIDILVLYNEQVRLAHDPSGGKANTVQFMHDAVDQTQLAMDNSTTMGQPTIAQVNFVAAKEVTRQNSGDLVADLDYVTHDPEPEGIRNYWSADVVMYVTQTGGPYAGIASEPLTNGLPGPGPAYAPAAAAVVVNSYTVLDGWYVFAHEFAHNLGANHNLEEPHNSTPVEPWAYGHWGTNADQGDNRTIMSYQESTCTSPCTRILNYSNGHVVVDSFHTGIVNQQENARVINDVAPITAQYCGSLGRIFADGFE